MRLSSVFPKAKALICVFPCVFLSSTLFITIILLLVAPTAIAQSTHLEVVKDTVKVINAELLIQNSTKSQKGMLYNEGGGRTAFYPLRLVKIGDSSIALSGFDTLNISKSFKLLQGKTVQFRAGLSTGYPVAGDSTYTNSDFIGRSIKVWRNGLLQDKDQQEGFLADTATGKIIFRPRLLYGDRVFIEAMGGIDMVIAPSNVWSTNLTKLNAGALDNLDNTFTVRWATNDRTLTNSPRMFGMGSSTLYGHGLSYPDRLGDRIQLWLNGYSISPIWINVAVSGYTSANIQSVSNGGIDGHNIDTALKANPDFIYVVLASNDPGASISVAQSLANYRRIDSIAFSRGIPVFFNTTQPRTSYSSALQTQLKETADSLRAIFPDRYVEAFKIVADTLAATDAVIRYSLDQGDGTHLNPQGIQLIANSLFRRLQQYFQPIYGVAQYVIEASSDKSSWYAFDVVTDQNIVKKTYNKNSSTAFRYFRVRAVYQNNTTSAWSNVAPLAPAGGNPPSSFFDHRVLVDVGGDGLVTINGNGNIDGILTPSPDDNGNHWNNWTGLGASGFDNGAQIGNLVTSTNKGTAMSVRLIGSPLGSSSSGTNTYAMNFSGLNNAVGDYPKSAVYDNMYVDGSVNNTGGITLRIKGLIANNIYYVKLWGARVEAGGSARTMLAKLGGEPWSAARSFNARYNDHVSGDYNRGIQFTNITGVDSVDINIQVNTSTSSFAHLSLLDIGILGTIPATPSVIVRDTTLTLPDSSVQLTPSINLNGSSITSYQWTQISGPNAASFTNANTAQTTIRGLTNGTFVFRLSCNTPIGVVVRDDVTVRVLPTATGGKVLRINFSGTPMPEVPGWFNVYGVPHAAVITATDPVTNWGVSSVAISGGYWVPTGGTTTNDVAGAVTTNNSGIVPDLILKSFWFNTIKVTGGNSNVIISGLNTSKTYNLRFVCSRIVTDGSLRYGSFYINGGAEIRINAANNSSALLSENSVSPDSNGKINIGVYAPNNTGSHGGFSIINGLIIEEN